jgi:hypothetical protein
MTRLGFYSQMNFAHLFRKSTFARFNPQIPFIFSKTTQPPVLPNFPLQFEAVEREPRFGIKSEPPARQYGKSVDFVSLTALDGDLGLPVFTDAKDRVLKRKIYSYLEKLLATGGNDLPRIPGRVIESCEGGFLIGIGPVRAHLPQSEIPAGVNFNYYDMLDRKAYYFNLKSIQTIIIGSSSSKRRTGNDVDIFCVDQGHDQKSSKKQVSLYSKYSQDQGFKVILTLRK